MAVDREKLAALGIYDHTSVAENAFARVLLIGPAKSGKTTCLASTAPDPLIINCDGQGATVGAVNQSAEFAAVDAVDVESWKHAYKLACKLASDGTIRSIILDTVTLLIDGIQEDLDGKYTGYDLWRELIRVVKDGIRALKDAEAHLFVTAHISPRHDDASGILPAVPGKLQQQLPALLDDWVMLDVEPDRRPDERIFLLGPQKYWTHSGRNVRRTCSVPADVGALLDTLGIKA